MIRQPSITIVTWLLLSIACIAQIEPNDSGGSLRSMGADPTPGAPFQVPSTGGMISLEVGGMPLKPYILLAGTYTGTGTMFPVLGNQALNLDLSQSVAVIGDGIGGTGILPSILFSLDYFGGSSLGFPTSPGATGQRIAFTAITSDPTAPAGLNITATAEFEVTGILTTEVIPLMTPTSSFLPAGDDGTYTHTLQGGPYLFYGQVHTQITVSSNGWIRFDDQAVTSGAGGYGPEFFDGTVGMPQGSTTNAPIVAALWADLDFSNTYSFVGSPGSIWIIEDLSTNTVRVEFLNGGYIFQFGFGDVIAEFTFSGLSPAVTLDYTNYASTIPQGYMKVGVSDGNTGSPPGADVEADWITNGVVNATTASQDFFSYFQDFAGTSGTVAQEYEDLTGHIITFQDLSITASGQWSIY